ncbi:ribonuclease H-like domain-containing protein [Tanacetum coccineum]|uniref:Ribonuclease H-like domain-containing protein n=1 Tax=Tanacetum coccineum TaxID=301880 RepID=A0ABQ5C0A0_9ASTR
MNCHATTTSPLPQSHVHALRGPNWKQAILDEYNALIINGMWVLVPRPANVNVVRSIQQQGIDCDETFSLVVKPVTIRTVLSLAVSPEWHIHQLDVKNAFLHKHLSETRSKTDTSLFVFNRGSYIAYLLSYVDDIILTASSATLLQRIIALLHSKFAKEILERAHLEKCNPCKTLVDTNSKLSSDGEHLQFTDLKRILRYVRGTIDYGLELHVSSTAQHTSYSDADWAGCLVTLSRSSDVAWIRNLLCELHTPLFIATLFYCDNVSAIYMSANPVKHQLMKHAEIDIHFVRDFVASGHVRVLYVPSRFQYANIFTKGLHSALFLEFRSSLNVPSESLIAGIFARRNYWLTEIFGHSLAGIYVEPAALPESSMITGQECPYPCYPPPTGGSTSGGGGGNPPPTSTTFSPPSQIGYYPPPSSIFPYNPPKPNYYGNGQPAPDPVVPWFPYYYKKPPHKTDDSSSSGVPIVFSSRIFLIHVLVFSFMLLAH